MLQWTSTDLARRSGIHGRTICKLEKGEAQPQRKTLAAIVGALSAGGVNSLAAAFGSRAVNAKTEFPDPIKRRRKAPWWNFATP
jgi:predicted transcriptional regulator